MLLREPRWEPLLLGTPIVAIAGAPNMWKAERSKPWPSIGGGIIADESFVEKPTARRASRRASR